MATTFEDAHNATQPEPKMIPATITQEQLLKVAKVLSRRYIEEASFIDDATAALAAIGISVEGDNE